MVRMLKSLAKIVPTNHLSLSESTTSTTTGGSHIAPSKRSVGCKRNVGEFFQFRQSRQQQATACSAAGSDSGHAETDLVANDSMLRRM